jgi:hypothetical protein
MPGKRRGAAKDDKAMVDAWEVYLGIINLALKNLPTGLFKKYHFIHKYILFIYL